MRSRRHPRPRNHGDDAARRGHYDVDCHIDCPLHCHVDWHTERHLHCHIEMHEMSDAPELPTCPRCGAECMRSPADPHRAACARLPHYFAVHERGAWHEEPTTPRSAWSEPAK